MKTVDVLVDELLNLMGGPSNIASVTHCATRLRPKFHDISKVNTSEIEKLDGVEGIVKRGSNLQVIVGLNVGEIYDEFVSRLNNSEVAQGEVEEEKGFVKWFNAFVALVVAIFIPLLPLLAGSGLIRGLTILANNFGVLPIDSPTNTLLTLMATSVFYFLPILVALTTAKRFKTSPYIAVAILGAVLMPTFIALVEGNGGNTIPFFGINMPVYNYSGQVISAILIVWIQSVLEHFLQKKIPVSLQMFIIPTILLFVLLPLFVGIIGPFSTAISIWMASFVEIIENWNPILTGAIVGGIWNILIMFGIHWAPNTMVIIPIIAKKGQSPLVPYAATANFGMAGAALAIYLKTRNKELKTFSMSAIVSVMLSGIVEPAIYGLGARFKTPLIAGCLGAALGGAFMGAFGVVGYAFVFGGLTTIPAFAGPTLWAYVVGLAIAFVGGMILTWIFGIKDPEAEMN